MPLDKRDKDKGMWKLVLMNSNHPTYNVVIIKSSCLPLLKYIQWNLYTAFKKFQYRDKFTVQIESCESGGIIATDSTIPESKL